MISGRSSRTQHSKRGCDDAERTTGKGRSEGGSSSAACMPLVPRQFRRYASSTTNLIRGTEKLRTHLSTAKTDIITQPRTHSRTLPLIGTHARLYITKQTSVCMRVAFRNIRSNILRVVYTIHRLERFIFSTYRDRVDRFLVCMRARGSRKSNYCGCRVAFKKTVILLRQNDGVVRFFFISFDADTYPIRFVDL